MGCKWVGKCPLALAEGGGSGEKTAPSNCRIEANTRVLGRGENMAQKALLPQRSHTDKNAYASQVPGRDFQPWAPCCPRTTANTALFRSQSHPGLHKKLRSRLMGHGLGPYGGRDLCGTNSAEFHCI